MPPELREGPRVLVSYTGAEDSAESYRKAALRGASGAPEHFLINREGVCHIGRPLPWWGLGSGGDQSRTILVTLEGKSKLTRKQETTYGWLVQFLASLALKVEGYVYADEDLKAKLSKYEKKAKTPDMSCLQ